MPRWSLLATAGWPGLDRWLDRALIRFACLVVLALAVLLVGACYATSDRGTTVFGPALGPDFAAFYCTGLLLNLPPPEDDRLYDLETHRRLYREVLPNVGERDFNPFVYPPVVAFVLRPLALLPYEWAYAAWLLISAGLYVGGFELAWRSLRRLPADYHADALLLALAFEPFIIETWIGGHIVAIGFFCLALAVYLMQAGRPVAAGSALGLCLYKPTMLVLFLPLLVVGRRWRLLAGVALGGLFLAGTSWLTVGRESCERYLHLLFNFGQSTRAAGLAEMTIIRPEWKWVDLNYFFRQLLGGPHPAIPVLLAAVAAAPLFFLVRAWWRYDELRRGFGLLWAATLTWSLVINLYTCIYDTIPLVIAALLTADVVYRTEAEGGPGLPAVFRYLLLLLALAALPAQLLARATGLQVYPLLLMALGTYQLVLLFRNGSADPGPPPGGAVGY